MLRCDVGMSVVCIFLFLLFVIIMIFFYFFFFFSSRRRHTRLQGDWSSDVCSSDLWADFRCHQLNSYYAEMAQFIHSLNPNVVISTNPHSGISGRNTIWDQGVDYPGLLPYMDLVWTEEGDEAGVTPEGILVSKIRTYKMASSLGKRVLTYTAEIYPNGTLTSGKAGGKLQMAESMAYNRQCLGEVGDVLAGYSPAVDQRRYIKFFVDHFDRYRQVANVAHVAGCRFPTSIGLYQHPPPPDTQLFSQGL